MSSTLKFGLLCKVTWKTLLKAVDTFEMLSGYATSYILSVNYKILVVLS